ncbi:serine/threonine protein kinase [Geodermatophilus saharensis]|uniref:non-specific serine/threonine protein kinase n=1 Tax=Geodermatophilus saharensis TaxID=1137994 RepID=A0A239CVE8_9ACTN|nr:serine/threonine protein kinase [Geodermatophilus saharensis]SNS23899.1 serine/threonine protein kinase [Geodermatophilus saharensis]
MTSLGTGRQTLGDRYELQELIATGGMGQVWRGRDQLLLRPVAVKVLRSEYADDPVFLERFRCEARHAAALSHPNIAAVLDYGESDDAGTGEHLAYLVMELVDGAPLSELLAVDGPLEPDAALSVLRQTAAALSEAHRAGLVHRDVKPANILVRPDGRVKLTDFGIAWSAQSVPLTGTGQVVGTARYMSPEQAAGERVSPASDVYALGLVGYESLTGHAAFDGTNPVTVALKQVREDPQPLPDDVPPRVRSLIGAALAKDPAARLPDAGAFLAAVEQTIEQAARPAPPAPPPARAVATDPAETAEVPAAPASGDAAARRRARLLVLTPVLALLLVGLLAVVLWRGGSDGGRPPAQAAETSAGAGGSAAAATAVVLTASDHVGRPADEVAADLTALGLTVEQRTEETTAVEPGTVADLDPVGVPLQRGDVVTLVVAAAPSAPAPAPGGGAPAGSAGGTASEGALSGPPAAPSATAPPETVPSGTAPPETAPSDTAPTDGAPTDTAPTGSAPTATPPTGSAPTDTAPTDAAPTGTAPTDAAPTDTAPADTAPTDTAPTGTPPTGTPPSEPTDPTPTDTAPTEPSDPAPTEPGASDPDTSEPPSSPSSSVGPSGSATPSAPAGTPPAPDTGAAG